MPFWRLPNLFRGNANTNTNTNTRTRKKRSAPPSSTSRETKRRRTSNTPSSSYPSSSKDDPPIEVTLERIKPPNRWNPAIDPSTPEFKAVLSAFRSLLRVPDPLTIESVLTSCFTHFELDLLRPVARGEPTPEAGRAKELAKIQEANRVRYKELLRSARFKPFAGKADLAFKFTLAWFGLPVAPLFGGGWYGTGELSEGAARERRGWVDDGKGEELRYLNAYTKRSYSKDAGIRQPDAKLESYYPEPEWKRMMGPAKEFMVSEDGFPTTDGFTATLSLRGGDADEDMFDIEDQSDISSSSGDMTPDEEEDLPIIQANPVSVRGGAYGSTFTSNIFKEMAALAGAGRAAVRWSAADQSTNALHTDLSGSEPGVTARWLPLYGYQGVVWFRTDIFHTFVDAVDRLLCLDNRAGVAYNLYVMDKSKNYATQAARDEFLRDTEHSGISIWASGPGDYSNDHIAWEWLIKRLGAIDGDDDGEADRTALFVAGPSDPIPWTWEPDASHNIQKVVLDWASMPRLQRPDIAYLRMPSNPTDVACLNQYGPWMANVCRVLAPGRIAGRPGQPVVPDAWFTLRGRAQSGMEVGTYGGLDFDPKLWDAIVNQWAVDRNVPVTLDAKAGQHGENGTDRWHLFLPGNGSKYKNQYLLLDKVGDAKYVRDRIMRLVEQSLPIESLYKVQSLEVHLPGTGFFLQSEGGPELVVSVAGEDLSEEALDAAFQPVVDRIAHWMGWLKAKPGYRGQGNGLGLFPQFLTIRPVFTEYSVSDDVERTNSLSWDPAATTLVEFQNLAAELLAADDYSPGKSWIKVVQGDSTRPEERDTADSKPSFLVGPITTETEWQSIVNMIVEPQVFISLFDDETLPRFGDMNSLQPFGYRDIYQTPKSLLYYALDKGQVPKSQRHHDWQMWGENPTAQLETVQPWEEQPSSLSDYFEPDAFALRLPPGTRVPPARQANSEARMAQSETSAPDAEGNQTAESNQSAEGIQNPDAPSVTGFQETDVERGHRMREYSYAHPLDVQTFMSIPINAPPINGLLNLKHDSVPIVSLSVLTPTEIRRMQRDYHNMRNLVLTRVERCPYGNCGSTFPADKPSEMQQHLREKHLAEKCNFCDDPLFAFWNPAQRNEHFIEKHSNTLKSLASGQPAPGTLSGGKRTKRSEPTDAADRKTTKKAPQKKKRAAAPPTINTTGVKYPKDDEALASSSSSGLSSPPSSTHIRRPSATFRPRERAAAPPPPPPPPPPQPEEKQPSPPKTTKSPKAVKPVKAAAPKKAGARGRKTAAAATAAAAAKPTYNTRSGNKRNTRGAAATAKAAAVEAGEDDDDESESESQDVSPRPAQGRTVSFAEGLVRGASPRREVRTRLEREGRLAPALRSAAAGSDGAGARSGRVSAFGNSPGGREAAEAARKFLGRRVTMQEMAEELGY